MSMDQLEKMVGKGKVTRRQFVKGMSALGLGAALAGPLGASPLFAATPKKGGRFRMGLLGHTTSSTLDPATNFNIMEQIIGRQWGSSLIEIDADGKLIPELAESWESSEKAGKWVIKLRRGVEFHNGKTMDAEDVIYSIRHHISDTSKSIIKSLFEPIKEIRADGKHTVVVTLENGNADFPWLLTDLHALIMPKDSDPNSGVGTGGYIIDAYEPGIRTLGKRFPNYFKENAAFFDEVECWNIADKNARVNSLRSGDLDYVCQVNTKLARLLSRDPNVEVLNYGGLIHYCFSMLTDVAPFSDNNVRMALKHAINREQLVKMILNGYGSVANDHPLPASHHYFSKDIPQREYDPEKAKFFLKKSGLGSLDLELYTSDNSFSGAVDASLLFQQSAAKAGIRITPKKVPNDGYWKTIWRKKPWFCSYWTTRSSADWILSLVYGEDSTRNETNWKNPGFNKILKEARIETDEARRKAMYHDLQYMIRDDGGAVIPMFASFVEGISKKVGYSKLRSDWEVDGARPHERMWFK